MQSGVSSRNPPRSRPSRDAWNPPQVGEESMRYSVGNPVKSARQSFSGGWLVLLSAAVLTLAGCDRSGGRSREIAYVSAPQVALRDQVAAVYNKTGMVKNGDRLEV